jgi:hypothetical protein
MDGSRRRCEGGGGRVRVAVAFRMEPSWEGWHSRAHAIS